jgi:hypothetical protein
MVPSGMVVSGPEPAGVAAAGVGTTDVNGAAVGTAAVATAGVGTAGVWMAGVGPQAARASRQASAAASPHLVMRSCVMLFSSVLEFYHKVTKGTKDTKGRKWLMCMSFVLLGGLGLR